MPSVTEQQRRPEIQVIAPNAKDMAAGIISPDFHGKFWVFVFRRLREGVVLNH